MVGGIAAIAGARRGRERGQEIARRRSAQRSSEIQSYREMKERMAGKIIETFDSDNSGGLSKTELIPMLQEYSKQMYKEDVQPTADDIEFLFQLCDKSGGAPDGRIGKQEVMGITEAWGEFMSHKSMIKHLIEAHDIDGDGGICMDELQGVLDEVKDADQIRQVVPDVTAWIFKQSDLNKNGVLSTMELARALVAYDMWVGKRTMCSFEPEQMMIGIRRDDSLMKPKKSSDSDWARYKKQKEKVLAVLKGYDVNGDNRYSLEIVSQLLIKLGISEDEAKTLVQAIDKNHDAIITVDEFVNWIFSSEDADAASTLKAMAPGSAGSSSCSLM